MRTIIFGIFKTFLQFFNLTFTSKINDQRFNIPILGNLGSSNLFISEIWMVDVLKKITEFRKGTFVDVGVNIGQTLLKLKSVSRDINYIGFEPNPNCVYYVRKLIQKNKFGRVSLIPVGISTRTELTALNFYSDNETDGSASIVQEFRTEAINRKEFIPIFRLDDLKLDVNLDDMAFLKIDVEGAELEVLESFKNYLKRANPFILIEILPVYDRDKNFERYSRQEKIAEILTECNYSIFRIIKTGSRFKEFHPLDNFEIHSDLTMCDYLLSPQSEREQLL